MREPYPPSRLMAFRRAGLRLPGLLPNRQLTEANTPVVAPDSLARDRVSILGPAANGAAARRVRAASVQLMSLGTGDEIPFAFGRPRRPLPLFCGRIWEWLCAR
jgi:hypothetical protein